MKRYGADPARGSAKDFYKSAEVTELEKLLANVSIPAKAFRDQLIETKMVPDSKIETARFLDELEVFKRNNLLSEKKEVL